jgi:hypothetical protein
MLPYTTYHIPESAENKTGNSNKWLWMIVRQPLSAPEEDLLLKISTALKADFTTEVHCIPFQASTPVSLSATGIQHPRLIISFGAPPADLGIWVDLNRPGICTLESMSFILTLPVDALSGNTAAKKELWNCMQIYMERN